MSENKVKDLLGVSMDKIKEMVDVNTIVGEPIVVGKLQLFQFQRFLTDLLQEVLISRRKV